MARGGPDYSPYKPVPVFGTGYDNISEVWQVNVPAAGWSIYAWPAVPAGHEYYISSIAASMEVPGVAGRVAFTRNAVAQFDSYFNCQGYWDFRDKYRIVPTDAVGWYLHNLDSVVHTFLFVINVMDVTMNP